MNPRSILSISAMTTLALALLPGSAIAQQKSLKDQLVGAWTLVSYSATAANGTRQETFRGANPNGILILDASGRYASVTARGDRTKFKANGRAGATTEEFAAAARTFGANFGTWSVNEADKTLAQRWESALVPNNMGQETKASVSVAGDELKLTAAPAAGGREESVFRRAK
jgi:hypothetical protein